MSEHPLPKPVPPLEPVPAAHSRIVLTGPPAAGKSTIGRLLADRLGLPLTDTDANIVDRHGVIADIFVERGEDHFRRLEREVVRRALRRLLDRPGIVSLGGGAILNSGTRAQLLHPAIKVVHIDIDTETVAPRLNAPHRPLLRGAGSPVENWLALVAEREPLYQQVATFRVHASNSPPSTVVNRIVDVLTGLQRAEDYAKYQQTKETP
ncbi:MULTISPECIES: shikimate kinase [Brevibacterium]|uniref:Shikimate kinase n=1 Tax=Brevibacterium casei TaxID=33889 RepID=A0A7T3ZXZ2_9MICO|nr:MULTISPECIES: shikimate kinase [Brevibacterium]MCM1012545.1 AAA family ATPase [Brevibacterium sp. XM4083]QQB13723.1 AAA family ATPase [Brevibacterium casei]